MVRGLRNDSGLYLQGAQGIGKSHFFDFLEQFVIGYALTLKTENTTILTGQFNAPLMGKLLVVFEELPSFNKDTWMGISNKLKNMITTKKLLYEEKHCKAIKAENMGNFVFISNHKPIQDADGRRYYCFDLSTKHRCDHKYFGNLIKKCWNDEVGEAFYAYLQSVEVPEDWNSQADMPVTEAKKDAIAVALDSAYQFIRDEYYYTHTDIRTEFKDMYAAYLKYCGEHNIQKYHNKIDFGHKLSEVGIPRQPSNGQYLVKLRSDGLAEIVKKQHWAHELDDARPVKAGQPVTVNHYLMRLLI